jgi:uncharacterized protein YidB (DUF937 family)
MVVTFDNLVDDIDARYCLGPKAAPFIQETSRLVTKHPGGIGGVVRRFRDAGFAVEVASWLGGSDPVPLSGQEVEQTLGSEVVSGIANKIGVSQRFAGTILGYAIPSIIVLMAQGGAVPSALRASVLRIFGLAIPRFPSRPEEITKHTTQQIPPSITEGSDATPVLGGLIIPCTTLLLTLALALGYYVGTSDREVIQSSPVSPQIAPLASLPVASMIEPLPSSNENYAFVPIAGSGATPRQSAGGSNPLTLVSQNGTVEGRSNGLNTAAVRTTASNQVTDVQYHRRGYYGRGYYGHGYYRRGYGYPYRGYAYLIEAMLIPITLTPILTLISVSVSVGVVGN